MIGVAIIGMGTVSDRHIEAYLTFSSRCQILAICDISREKAEIQREKYHLKDACIYLDYEEMLKRSDVLLVSICTPPFAHALAAIRCMQAGKHVLTEKPMASSLEECDEMMKIQRETGCFLSVISQNRYLQDNWNLKMLLSSEAAGKIVAGQVESCWYRGESYYDPWWRGTWEYEGGGCILNHGVHQIDLLNWIMGRPRSVTAVLGNIAHKRAETEDISAAILTYDNGVIVTLMISLVTHGEGQRMVFQCERASLAAPWEVKSSRSNSVGFPEPDSEFKKQMEMAYEALPCLLATGHTGQIDHVLCCLEAGWRPDTKGGGVLGGGRIDGCGGMADDGSGNDGCGNDGRLAIEVITAIYQSAFMGQTVFLPLEKNTPYYTKDEWRAQERIIRYD